MCFSCIQIPCWVNTWDHKWSIRKEFQYEHDEWLTLEGQGHITGRFQSDLIRPGEAHENNNNITLNVWCVM